MCSEILSFACSFVCVLNRSSYINLWAPEFGILISAHPVCKMQIIQEPKKVELSNKPHFEEE
jgi:hypothetical protein